MAGISLDEEGESACRCGVGRGKSKITLTLPEYMEAFHILIAVRVERFPGDAGGMLKHIATVQGLHKLFGAEAWPFYDRHFRLSKEHSFGISWDTADAELYMQAVGVGYKQKLFPQPFHKVPAPKGAHSLCWKFQRTGGCFELEMKICFEYSHRCLWLELHLMNLDYGSMKVHTKSCYYLTLTLICTFFSITRSVARSSMTA
ncbi:hypothetical protein CAPTEDRAFT_211400 [Capitella teleta]|uniref:Uncharacterized protein n=1 Tax=Capitella teleta TaxID=283909 RepID=R7TJR6_CAPTE|nr:hypothetical protein CAPTEDRAFT_211400 [Capitella teleta]|eukprot:ELT91325.1 hypothetical protein CAPTEDRAFT_211400 [Capitella teleta]